MQTLQVMLTWENINELSSPAPQRDMMQSKTKARVNENPRDDNRERHRTVANSLACRMLPLKKTTAAHVPAKHDEAHMNWNAGIWQYR